MVETNCCASRSHRRREAVIGQRVLGLERIEVEERHRARAAA
jgi:hypothetical protein